MKFKKTISAIIAAVMLLCVACGDKSGKGKEYSKEIVSYDYKYKIETPVDWKLDERSEMRNSGVTICALCPERCVEIGAQVTEIGENLLPFDNFCNMVVKNLNSQYLTTVSVVDFEDKNVNGLNMKYFEIKDMMAEGYDQSSRLWCYMGEVDGCYVMFVAETLEKFASDELHEEVEMIISTFQRFEV